MKNGFGKQKKRKVVYKMEFELVEDKRKVIARVRILIHGTPFHSPWYETSIAKAELRRLKRETK